METKKCDNCGNEISVNAEICPYCGKSFSEKLSPDSSKLSLKGDDKMAIISVIIAVLGIVVTFACMAWLGIPIYLVGFFISAMTLRSEIDAQGGSFIDVIKDCLKNKGIVARLMAIVVLIMPIVLVIGIFIYIP